jgi:hypothetical protein
MEPGLADDGALCDPLSQSCPRPRPSCHPDMLAAPAPSSSGAPAAGATPATTNLAAACAALGVLAAGALALAAFAARRSALMAAALKNREQTAHAEPSAGITLNPIARGRGGAGSTDN